MKKVLLVGGSGQIGRVLNRGLRDRYDVFVLDKNVDQEDERNIRIDAADYDDLLRKMPEKADVMINLLSIPVSDGLVEHETAGAMSDLFLKATYYLYLIACRNEYAKCIFSSSGHVTDYYVDDGHSRLGREVNVNDYPYSRGLYGTLKLACENIGHAFHTEKGLSVINLRIGAIRENEREMIRSRERYRRTWLTTADAVRLYERAIEADIRYGVYYGVSDNPGKPWDMENAYTELGFKSVTNALDILRED